MPVRTLVILNPRSRAGAGARLFARVEASLRDALGALEVERTRGPRDAERIAREGVRAGVERLVVAGGDGTVSEVVAGLLGADLAGYCQIGLLPLGTGGDLARTLAVPTQLDAAVANLAHGTLRVIDAGRAVFTTHDGAPCTSFFLNVASAGISGLVTELVNRGPKHLGGRISFLVGTLRGIARYRFPPVRVRADGALLHEGPATLVAAGNGRCFGGGMAVAPDARIDDGFLDAVVVPGFSRARLVCELPRIYRGTHIGVDGVAQCRVRSVALEPLGAEPVWIELDGEPSGRLPARFDALPKAITLFGAPAPGA
ncbi:MAG TPA: diacylglycerol kinase family protein [Myxococcota bacterium]|nr:diacylglycerol kinase family protein [Myxococcota bacterium]